MKFTELRKVILDFIRMCKIVNGDLFKVGLKKYLL